MPPFTDTRVTTSECKWRNFYMKATGIVRRIDETAIIGPSQKNLVKSMGFADLVFFFYGSGDESVN